MKTAVYARVSSEAQEKQQTIESQLTEPRAYPEADGLALAAKRRPVVFLPSPIPAVSTAW